MTDAGGTKTRRLLGGAIRLGVGPNVSRASRAQDRGGDAPAAPLRRPCRRGTRPSCPCGPSPCGSGRGDEGGWVSAGRARFPRDDRVSVGTRTGPKKNCKDPTSAVAGDEAQSRDCRQASCLVTFAFTRGSHLQPPAVVVLLGLIKACLDLAGVRELIVGVVVRPKLIRSAFETAKRIFCQNLVSFDKLLHSGRRGCRARPMSTAMASGGRSPFQALARVVYRHPVLVYLASLLVPALLAIGVVRASPFRQSLVVSSASEDRVAVPRAHRTA